MSITRARRLAALVALPALALGWTLALDVAPAGAAEQTRYVATTGDDGSDPVNACTDQSAPCKTIQHAVDEADAGDTVSVAAGTYAESVVTDKDVTISGAGQGKTVVTGNSDEATFAILPNDATISVVLTHLTAAHNDAAPGVVAVDATVRLTDVEVSDNDEGGVLGIGAAIVVGDSVVSDNTGGDESPLGLPPGIGVGVASGSVTVDHSTVSGNTGSGVAVTTESTEVTRGLAAGVPESVLTVRRSTVSGNADGGVVNFGGDATVDVSTVSGNVGGGVVSLDGSTTVTNSTVTGTTPFPNEGASVQGGLVSVEEAAAAATSANPLVPSVRRKAAAGRVVRARLAAHPVAARQQLRRLKRAAAPAATTSLSVSGSIVAEQKSLPDCFGSVTDSGNNLSSDSSNSCKFSAAKHDQTKTDPKLGPLADNGGATETQVPLKGSPAIDAIASGDAGCSAAATDQRDISRPQPAGGNCDTGAVELAAEAIVIAPASLPHGTVGDAYKKTITATGGQYPSYTWSLASGDLPDGLSLSSGGVISGTPTKAGTFTFVVSVNDPVTRRYTLVVDPAATGSSSGAGGSAQPNGGGSPLADTGAPTSQLATTGGLAVLGGLVLLVGAGFVGRQRGRHRAG